MEGWHPDGHPGNLAYSPELWEWMFELGLYLNYDPSHLLWLGIDPVAALKPYVDRVAHAHAKDAEMFQAERNRYGFFGRTSTRESDPWDMGWWRYRIPGLGEVDFRRYVDTLYEGGFDGVLSVEHEDPVWGGTPELVEAGLTIARNNLRGLVVRMKTGPRGPQPRQGVPGRQGAAGRRPRRPRGRGALPARAQRRRQVDADQVRLGRGRADERRDPLRGRAAAGRRPGGLAEARRRDDLPGARPRRGPQRRREHLPRARAAPPRRPAARPRQDVPRLGRAAQAPRPRVDPPAREGRRAAPGRAADRLDRARAVGRRAPADHGRAVGDPRRRRDRDAVRRRPPAHRRGRRRRLHLPSPRRDPAHRQPRDGARRRPHDGDRAAGDDADRRARRAHGRPQGRAALPRRARSGRTAAARGARRAAPAGGQRREPQGPRRRGRRPRRARRLRAHRAAAPRLRARPARGGRVPRSTASR